MDRPSNTEQLLDLFLLRTREPDYATDQPYYTTGSIVAAALFRVAIIAIGGLIATKYVDSDALWYVVLFLIWGIGAYPAYRQYQEFNDKVDRISEETLCGQCRHFDPTNQLCTILDEHITSAEPPCEGEGWEPK